MSILLPVPATAAVVLLPEHGVIRDLESRAGILPHDPGRSVEPADLVSGDGFVAFDPGLDRATGPAWLRLEFRARDVDGDYVLRVSRRFFSRFDLQVHAPDGSLRTSSLSSGRIDNARIVGREYAITVPARVGGTTRLLILVETAQGSLSPVRMAIEDRDGFAERTARTMLVLGLVFGIVLGLVFHNVVLYLSLRRRGHLLYVLAMVSLLLLLAIDSGLLQQHVLPDAWLAYEPRIYVALVALMLVSISLFFQAFVDSPRHLPRIDPWIRRLRWPLAALGAVALMLPAASFHMAAFGVQLLSSAMLVLLLVAALVASRRGIFEGHVFLAAWLILVASNVVRTLLTLDLVASSWLLEHLFYIGALVEAGILAMGLAYRVHELRRGHDDALRKQLASDRLANLDSLTGAYNRRFLMQHLGQVAGAGGAGGGRYGLLMLDLDGFKQVNDSLGHVAGDEVLREVVRRCRRVLREEDVLCRLGGDEFVAVLRAPQEGDAVDLAHRIRKALGGSMFELQDTRLSITASIGVVPDLGQTSDPAHAVQCADDALYRAKRDGRDRVAVWTERPGRPADRD